MKSKVKNVESTKEWAGPNGTIIYHNLEMDNGDKINIGKKKLCSIGDELSYEIIDSGQEYNKAKTLIENNFKGGGKSDDYMKGIEVGHAINNAVNMMCAGVEMEIPETAVTTEQKIYYGAKRIMLIAEKLKSE